MIKWLIVIGSVQNSYLVFVDPASLPEVQDHTGKMLFSFLLMISGLILTGFIISVLSSSLENTFRDIRSGRLDYTGENHTIIINYNHKVEKILDELNLLHTDHNDVHDVVILINDETDVEKLQDHISDLENKLSFLKIFIRYGDVVSLKRYHELSFLNAYSIIILSDDNIKDPFDRDNNSIRIVNLLFTEPNFKTYLEEKKKKWLPVKAIVELENIDYSTGIIEYISSSLFQAISPNNILESILNLSMINIDFYNIWSELLSFEGHELYFISAKEHNLHGSTYKDVLLRHKKGLLLGISRTDESGFKLHLNEHNEVIKENDWLLFIAEDKNKISFSKEPLTNTPTEHIEQPQEIYVKNVAILGDKKDICTNELLDMDKSTLTRIIPTEEEYADEEFYRDLVEKKDTIIMNMDDELVYRLALALKMVYKDNIPSAFVFLVDSALIASHLESAGIKNTILSHNLVSKYITQVSNQLSLYNVFNILFQKDGPEVNFIVVSRIAEHLLTDLNQLKAELVSQNMVYLGCENHDRSIHFEATDLSNAKKIIVFSDGEF